MLAAMLRQNMAGTAGAASLLNAWRRGVGRAAPALSTRSFSSAGGSGERDEDGFLEAELERFAAEARIRRQAMENRDIDVSHGQQRLCLTGIRGQSFEYSTLQAHIFGGNSKIPALAAQHPSPPPISHGHLPSTGLLQSPPPPPAPAAAEDLKFDSLDPVLDQRLWLHELAPTMEFSAECSRLAFGDAWNSHEQMLGRAVSITSEVEAAEAAGSQGSGGRNLLSSFEEETERYERGLKADGVHTGKGRGMRPVSAALLGESLEMSSVLKKRKKKMNKHKHKKRMKRDRGYSKD